jgi:hypothetical protein
MVACSVCLVANYGGATTADRKLAHRQWQAAAATSFVAASRECEGMCQPSGELGQVFWYSPSRAEGRGTRQPWWGALTRMEDTH